MTCQKLLHCNEYSNPAFLTNLHFVLIVLIGKIEEIGNVNLIYHILKIKKLSNTDFALPNPCVNSTNEKCAKEIYDDVIHSPPKHQQNE